MRHNGRFLACRRLITSASYISQIWTCALACRRVICPLCSCSWSVLPHSLSLVSHSTCITAGKGDVYSTSLGVCSGLHCSIAGMYQHFVLSPSISRSCVEACTSEAHVNDDCTLVDVQTYVLAAFGAHAGYIHAVHSRCNQSHASNAWPAVTEAMFTSVAVECSPETV